MPTILIVDDVVENVRMLKQHLHDIGQIVFATSGEEGLEQAQRHNPDIILLDVMMSGMDGYETCRHLKALPETRHIPVLFITGAGGESDEEMGLALGAIDYITKPFSPNIVRARVKNHLALVSAERAHRQWVADTSHELRTPITILGMHLEAMRDGVFPINASTLGVLSDTVNAMERLVTDLHQLASTDAGAHTFHFEAVNMADLVDEACSAFAASFLAHGLTLSQENQATVPVMVMADRQRMSQVLANLLGNTIRYTDTGGQARITLSLDAAGACRIRVDDSAPGVPDSALPRMFERFFRVDESRSRAGGGSGLGLAICQATVQAHGGAMTAAHSALGGVCVEMILPGATL
ncbi:MAG: ATP-binding protein [Pseudomonadota bacterium]